MRVLLVDDSQLVRERLLSLVAEIDGVDLVDEAPGGDEALIAVAAHTHDVVVLDLQMPRLHGLHVLRALRQYASPPTVIVFSNHTEYRQFALDAGASMFFDKATQVDELIATLANLASASAGTGP